MDKSALNSKISSFNSRAKDHVQKQASNPFSNENVRGVKIKQFSTDEYGRPPTGSLTESRGLKASAHICKEMLQLCEIIEDYGEPLATGKKKSNDPRKIISFGELFSMYNTISNKLMGILLRTRKHKIIDFEGEILFQRRDDDVPIILLKRIEDIREELHQQIDSTLSAIHGHGSHEQPENDAHSHRE